MTSMWRSVMVATGLVVMAASAQAAPIQAGHTFTVSGGGSIRGGEFALTSTTNPKAFDDFLTFCIEVAQTINVPGGPYTVQALTKTTSTGTALSGGAAYLYTQFAQGTLGGYAPTQQDALQAAIWKFQGYDSFVIKPGVTVASWFAGSAQAQAFYNLAGAQAWQTQGHTGNVFVMQNVNANGGGVQDFVTLQSVPEPATLMLLGAGLAGAAARRRRRT